jgi:hypothetical protein
MLIPPIPLVCGKRDLFKSPRPNCEYGELDVVWAVDDTPATKRARKNMFLNIFIIVD